MKTIHILILNGPNLNLTGMREPHHYGKTSMASLPELFEPLKTRWPDLEITIFQSNHEGEIIDTIQQVPQKSFSGMVINPGAFTHTSVGIADAIRAIGIPTVEVHLSHVYAREEFRRNNLIAPVCIGSISGLGLEGYKLAVEYLSETMTQG